VADPHGVENLARQAFERFGAIDVWINNVGVGPGTPWWEMSSSEVEQTVAVNLTAPILASRTVLPYMRQAGKGPIINIGSVAGHLGVMGLYSATKFGVRGLTESKSSTAPARYGAPASQDRTERTAPLSGRETVCSVILVDKMSPLFPECVFLDTHYFVLMTSITMDTIAEYLE
jgi:hypothetical protein